MGVLPEYKRMGIGSSLINNAIDLASQLGFKAIDAGVLTDNLNMMRLLLSFEFTPVRFNYHARADGADVLFMKRYI